MNNRRDMITKQNEIIKIMENKNNNIILLSELET